MLNVRAFAVSIATIWGGAVLLMGWVASFGYGLEVVNLISTVYIGYGPGLISGLIGAVWGAIDGGIGGLIFAWLYNRLSRHFAASTTAQGGV